MTDEDRQRARAQAGLEAQRLLYEAKKLLDRAMEIADEHNMSLEFLGATYDDEMWSIRRFDQAIEWSSSEDCFADDPGKPGYWNSSGCTGG